MSGYVSARFDFPERASPEKILVVASSYRSGSTFVGLTLWKDGRFGAPFEYFNFEKHMDYFMARLNVDRLDEYVKALVPLRTSGNGVFSVKCHIHHYKSFNEKSITWKKYSEHAKYIYIDRKDKLAQAISMAKALQTNAWMSLARPKKMPLFYSKELIEECLAEVMEQCSGWWEWFNLNDIEPMVINYEEFVAKPEAQVGIIANWLGVNTDSAESISLPMISRQADTINEAWIERFLRERRSVTGN